MFKNSCRSFPRFFLAALIASAAFAVPGGLSAQDSKPAIQEPEYVYHVFLLGADNKLVALEQQKTTYKTDTHLHYWKSNITQIGEDTVPSTSSTVRVKPDAHFIVRVPDGFDPGAMVYLKPFVVEKGLRALPVASAIGRGPTSMKSTAAPDTSLALTFNKYGNGSIEIVPTKPLAPGEYAFGITTSPALGVACFGVDPK